MRWHHYLTLFFARAFLANIIDINLAGRAASCPQKR